jgi:hypothetical protein
MYSTIFEMANERPQIQHNLIIGLYPNHVSRTDNTKTSHVTSLSNEHKTLHALLFQEDNEVGSR